MRYLYVLPFMLVISLTHAKNAAADPRYAGDPMEAGRKVLHGIWGTDPDNDPIQEKLHDCETDHQSTAEVPICFKAAKDSYEQLLQTLVTENQERLGDTQTKWLEYREADKKIVYDLIHNSQQRGTIFGREIANHDLLQLRERIADIVFYVGAE